MPFEMHSFSGEALDSVQVDATSHLGSGDEKPLNDVQDFDAISTIITQFADLLYISAGALVQWLKLHTWKVGDPGFEPHSGLQVSRKQNVSSPTTRNDSIWLACSISDR